MLGPAKFISYIEDAEQIFERHNVREHQFADDGQLYDSSSPDDISELRTRLSSCVGDVIRWCAQRRLQLNCNKTEVIWFGSRASLKKISGQDRTLTVGDEIIHPSSVVRDLGVLLDSELTMKQHVAKVAASCFYHLRRLRQVRRRLGQEATMRLAVALIHSRLDYCNSALAGLPASTIEPLQRVQNAAAHLVLGLGYRDHGTPGLRQLHWLPVKSRIKFKVCTIMHSIQTRQCPSYLVNCVQSVSEVESRSRLRSAAHGDYALPKLRTKFGERAFSYSGPAAWNTLPRDLRSVQDSAIFKRQLKTLLFREAFVRAV